MNSTSSSRVIVWFSIARQSSTGRMVRATSIWPMLNSPSVPRSDTIIIVGIWKGTDSDASWLARVAKPLVCMSTIARVPPIQAPAAMPRASSSRGTENALKNGSACKRSINGRSTLSGT